MFDQINVNLATGEVTYPAIDGFTIDMERVYSTAALHSRFCSLEQAVKHAIHGQISAFLGARSLGMRS